MKPTRTYRAIILVNDAGEADRICNFCSDYGIQTQVQTDPETALDLCRANPPDLVVVQEELHSMTGLEFISALVRISWTTSVIIVMDADAETVHERTEGLGILGHIRHPADTERLQGLLDTFLKMTASAVKQS